MSTCDVCVTAFTSGLRIRTAREDGNVYHQVGAGVGGAGAEIPKKDKACLKPGLGH